MSARVGLSRPVVVTAAVAILEEQGTLDAVSLAAVAERLGVRTQSLYSHVGGLDGLRRELALHAVNRLGAELADAAMGRAGAEAVEAIIRAYLRFADAHPGLFAATLRAPGDDEELSRAITTVSTPLNLVFRSYGLDAEELVHWYRLVWATVCGFATLRRDGLFTRPGDPEDTITHLVNVFSDQLALGREATGTKQPKQPKHAKGRSRPR